MRRLVLAASLALVACKPQPSPEIEPSVPDRPEAPAAPAGLSDAEAKRQAMILWRDDDLQRHPKGSCAGCHGPDFLDLAVIGSTDEDLRRRAIEG